MDGVTRRSQRSHKASRIDMNSPSSDNDKSMNIADKKAAKKQVKDKDEMSLEKEKRKNINSASLESHVDLEQQSQRGRPQRQRKITEKAEEELKSKQKKAKINNSKVKVQKGKQTEEQMTIEHNEESSQEEKQIQQNHENNRETIKEENIEIKDEKNKNDSKMENNEQEEEDHVKQQIKKRNVKKEGKKNGKVDDSEDEKEQDKEDQENNQNTDLVDQTKEKENKQDEQRDQQTQMDIENPNNKKDEENNTNVEGKSTDIEELARTQMTEENEPKGLSENEKTQKEEINNRVGKSEKISSKPIKQAHKNVKTQKVRIQEEQVEENYIGEEVDQDIEEQEELDNSNNEEISADENLSNPNNLRPHTHSKARKMPWSEEEDNLVIKLVEIHGPMKWTFIAQHIPGRIGKQCRERWHNHLNPKIKKSAWSDEEEWLLFLCHKLKGNRWAEITLCMAGRTDNAIKNYWNSSMKKRLPQLCQRYSLLRKGIQVDYTVSELYKELEKDCLSQLLAMPEDKADQIYTTQLMQESKLQNSATQALSKHNEGSEQTLQRQSSAVIPTQKIKENNKSHKQVKTKLSNEDSSIVPTQTLNSQSNLVERTPVANNNNRKAYNLSEDQPNTAACTGDVKDILQRIPQSPVQFDEFKKQILLYSSHKDSQNFSSLQVKEQSPSENKNEDQISNLPETQKQQQSQESPSVDISWSDTKNLERMLSTPMSVQKYVQNNPQFADIIRTALKFPSNNQESLQKKIKVKKQKNLKSVKSLNSLQQLDQLEIKQETQQSLLNGEGIQEKQEELDLENVKQPKENQKKVTKKRTSKQQLATNDENSNSGVNKIQQLPGPQAQKSINNPKSSSREAKPSSKNSKKSQQLQLQQGNLPYYHPMYMMNHPYYNPQAGQFPSNTTGNAHPHNLPLPPPPPHLLNPHMFQPHFFRHPPQHNNSTSSNQQPQSDIHLGHKIKRPSNHLDHPNQQQQQAQSSSQPHHQVQFNSELQEIQEHNYQTPMKYQKNNSSQRIAQRQSSNIPLRQQQQNQQESPLKDTSSKNNNLSYNPQDQINFSDQLKNHNNNTPFELQNNTNSFLKENIHPNRGLLISSSQHHNILNNNSSERPHNLQYFTTPNKYETPSKLLDFDSDVNLNCGSIDHYFNIGMSVFSSNKKIDHTQNSAFKGFPTTPNNHHIHKSPF